MKETHIRTFSSLALLCLVFFQTGCTTTQVKQNPSSFNFYLQVDKVEQHFFTDVDREWLIESTLVKTDSRSKTFYYDFKINSNAKKFEVADIQFKYGDYGKWRMLKKERHLTGNRFPERIKKIIEFPITIKKNGEPHDQLIQLTLLTEANETKTINLIFGIKKCLAKKAKEFVCF